MFKIINKIGGRKVFIFILSAAFMIIGYYVIKEPESFKVFTGAVVAIVTTFYAGNVFEHKYTAKVEDEEKVQ